MVAEGKANSKIPTLIAGSNLSLEEAFSDASTRIAEEGDLAQARYSEWTESDVVLASGVHGTAFEMTIEVPRKTNSVQRFLLKIRVFVSSLFKSSADQKSSLTMGVQQATTSLSRDSTVDVLAALLDKRFRAQYGDSYDHVTVEFRDLTTAEERNPRYSNAPDRSAA
jgi:hypothetical protein